jgi:hypothetical protein
MAGRAAVTGCTCTRLWDRVFELLNWLFKLSIN